jgi:hypothetical protein
VLVPIYFFHRYQIESAVKVVGGLNYRYAVRGDDQLVTEMLTPQQQMKALDALLKTVEPNALMLPENLIKNIPPRPIGYYRHRELPKFKTGLIFDPLSLAETAADMTLGLVLHPERANRLVEHHARSTAQPAFGSVVDKLVTQTFKAKALTGYEGAVQRSVDGALFYSLAKLSVSAKASLETRAIASLKLRELKSWLGKQNSSDTSWKAFHTYIGSLINQLQEHPGEFKADYALDPPPGMPIGSFEGDFCGY